MKQVLIADVSPYADRKCSTCLGAGLIVVSPVGKPALRRACGCAVKRFVLENHAKIYVKTTDPDHEIVYWKDPLDRSCDQGDSQNTGGEAKPDSCSDRGKT